MRMERGVEFIAAIIAEAADSRYWREPDRFVGCGASVCRIFPTNHTRAAFLIALKQAVLLRVTD